MTSITRYDDIHKVPWVILYEDNVIEANYAFTELTGYSTEELINNSAETLFVNILKINISFSEICKSNSLESFYIFTKNRLAREVHINVLEDQISHFKIYFILEEEYSRLEKKFMYLHNISEVNQIGIAIYSVPDLTLLMANQRYIDNIFNGKYSKLDVIGRKMSEFAPGWHNGQKFWNNRLKSKEDFLMNETFVNGKYLDARFTPIIENDIIKFYIVIITECTERVMYRKRLETQANIINQQKEELEAIIENMSDIFAVVDKYGNYVKMNAKARELDPELLLGVLGKYTVNEIFYNEYGEPLNDDELPVNKLLGGLPVSNSRIAIKTAENDSVFDVKGTPVLDSDSKLKYGILNIHDVSNLVSQVKTIERHKKELEFLIENNNEAIIIIKNNNEFLQNKLAREWFFGKGLSEDVRDLLEILDYEGKSVQNNRLPIARVLDGEIIRNEKYILVNRSDNKKRILRVNGTPMFDEENNIMICIISMMDVTEEYLKEEMLKEHTEKLLNLEIEKAHALENIIKMKEDFITTISHEFKTPLTVINAIIQTMETFYSHEMSDKVKSYLRKIRQNSYRQLRLVNNLVDINRVNTDKFKIHKRNMDIVFLTNNITESVKYFAQQKGVELHFTSAVPKLVMGIDEEIYERILLNLLSNAIKFTPLGKNIFIEVRPRTNKVVILVCDEGIGIPKDKQKLVFERFGQVDNSLTRQAEGSGIGLSLVQTLVVALGGKITLKSRLNVGSIFRVTLPVKLVKDSEEETMVSSEIDKRLIQTAKIEFSHVYID